MHGCRQFVFWYARLIPLTNATLKFFLRFNEFYFLIKFKKSKSLLLIQYQMKVRIMSSRYVPYKLGYPYNTKVFTKSCWKLRFG